jgi:DNA-directed RNA polymerase specialized sigma24 family protein
VDDEAIYRRNRDDLVRYATVLVGPTAAEDVVSTVVLRVLARRRLSDLDDARAYLFRAVFNESRTRLNRPRSSLLLNDAADAPDMDPQHEVLAGVLALPVQQGAATYLVYWEGMSIAEGSTRPAGATHPPRRGSCHLGCTAALNRRASWLALFSSLCESAGPHLAEW